MSKVPRKAVRRSASANDEHSQPKTKSARLQHALPQRATSLARVLVCGQGDMGQLGLGDDDALFERRRPTLLESLENVVDISAGGMHNLVLLNNGLVYSFGCNDEGALGRDCSAEGSEFQPGEVQLPGKVVKISAGDSHSACLLEDGRVYAWGSFRDSHGNMGLTLEGNKRTPVPILSDMLCCDIASGADHLVMLTITGKVYTLGCGEQGQLGRLSLRSASGESRRGKTELLRPGQVYLRKKLIDAIWASNYCTFLRVLDTGAIYAFGLNNYKQLVWGKTADTVISPKLTQLEQVQQIAGGQHHTIVLKQDGSCHVIGRCDYGRLGLGKLEADVTELQPVVALAGKKIVSVSCGEAQTFAVTADGKLYAWGMGSNNQLGTGSEEDELEPKLIESKQTQGKVLLRAASGGQHSIFLVAQEKPTKTAKKTANSDEQKVNGEQTD